MSEDNDPVQIEQPSQTRAQTESQGRDDTKCIAEDESTAPVKDRNAEKVDYEIRYITINRPGPLGLAIASADPCPHLLKTLEAEENFDVTKKIQKCLRITGFTNESNIGEDAGIQPEDWLLCLEAPKPRHGDSNKDDIGILNADYCAVRDAAKKGTRPIMFAVARPRMESTHMIQVASQEARRMTEDKSSCQASVEPPASQEDVVPFCALCNGRPTPRPIHHAWCPKNPHFEESGADEILERVQQGVELDCHVCIQEYQDGRRQGKGVKHSKACLQNQNVQRKKGEAETPSPPPSKKAKRKDRKNEQANGTSSSSSRQKRKTSADSGPSTKRGRRIRLSKKILESEANLSDIGGDDSDLSAYESPSKARRPFQRLLLASKEEEKRSSVENPKKKGGKRIQANLKQVKSSNNTAKKKDGSGEARRISKPKSKQNRSIKVTAEEQTSRAEAERRTEEASESVKRRKSAKQQPETSDESEGEDCDLTISWEACKNPWGTEGFVESDVVAFTTSKGLGHHETHLPSPRYEIDPFISCPRYRRTHHPPEEGYHVIVLRRDLMATRPWGFTVRRHEFGGACLIHNVDPLSPAEAAVSQKFREQYSEPTSRCSNTICISYTYRRLFWERHPKETMRRPLRRTIC
jgi:hypothetical protein